MQKDGGRCDIEIWTYNLNNVDEAGIKKAGEELDAAIHLLSVPAWYRWMFKLHLSILRVFLHFPLLAYFRPDKAAVRAVNEYNPDIVWIYGEELAGLAACFPKRERNGSIAKNAWTQSSADRNLDGVQCNA